MPHLTLEYTRNLLDFDHERALLQLNKVLAGTGHFDEVDIKSRAIALDHFAIGTSVDKRAFVHARLSILSSRSPEIKNTLSNMLLKELIQFFPSSLECHTQLCVEIIDIDRHTYAKEVIQPALL